MIVVGIPYTVMYTIVDILYLKVHPKPHLFCLLHHILLPVQDRSFLSRNQRLWVDQLHTVSLPLYSVPRLDVCHDPSKRVKSMNTSLKRFNLPRGRNASGRCIPYFSLLLHPLHIVSTSMLTLGDSILLLRFIDRVFFFLDARPSMERSSFYRWLCIFMDTL